MFELQPMKCRLDQQVVVAPGSQANLPKCQSLRSSRSRNSLQHRQSLADSPGQQFLVRDATCFVSSFNGSADVCLLFECLYRAIIERW